MKYCCVRSSLDHPWVHDGLSPCFLDTLTSGLLLSFMLIFGSTQILVYRRYSTQVPKHLRPNSHLFHIQVLLHVCLPLLAITRLILQATVITPKHLLGHQVLVAVATCVTYPLSIAVVMLERRRQLPSIPTRGHGLVVLMFWALAVVTEGVALTSWFSPLWWWNARK